VPFEGPARSSRGSRWISARTSCRERPPRRAVAGRSTRSTFATAISLGPDLRASCVYDVRLSGAVAARAFGGSHLMEPRSVLRGKRKLTNLGQIYRLGGTDGRFPGD
jgi:hypothetical protein